MRPQEPEWNELKLLVDESRHELRGVGYTSNLHTTAAGLQCVVRCDFDTVNTGSFQHAIIEVNSPARMSVLRSVKVR